MNNLNMASSSGAASFNTSSIAPSYNTFSRLDGQEGLSLQEFAPIAKAIGVKPEDNPWVFALFTGSQQPTVMSLEDFTRFTATADMFDKLDRQKQGKGSFLVFLDALTEKIKIEYQQGRPVDFKLAQQEIDRQIEPKRQQVAQLFGSQVRPLTEILNLPSPTLEGSTQANANTILSSANISDPYAQQTAPSNGGGDNKWLGFLGLAVGALGIITSPGVTMPQKMQALQQQLLPQAIQTGVLSPQLGAIANLALSAMQVFFPT
jgi:hypothetical protein